MQEYFTHISRHHSPKVLKLLPSPHPLSLFLPAPGPSPPSRSDIRFNSYYAMMLVICTVLLDALLIFFSYVLILKSVLAVASQEEWHKSFQTCISHTCAVLVFYIPIVSLTIVHHFGKHLSPMVHGLMGNIYILVPPLLNPIIYSVKTQKTRS